MTQSPNLETAITETLGSADMHDLVSEYAELGLDSLLDEGVTRDIPIVNTIVGVARVGITIRDRLFARKLLEFLGPFDAVPPSERRQMVEKLEADPDYGRKVGEHLIELLDRIEAHKKPRMLARVFRAYNSREIDAAMLHRLTHAVTQLPAFDIPTVRKFHDAPSPQRPNMGALQFLTAAGLVNPLSAPSGMRYQLTAAGQAFVQLDLDRQE